MCQYIYEWCEGMKLFTYVQVIYKISFLLSLSLLLFISLPLRCIGTSSSSYGVI
jgi:hypothetical protein